jgi:hypothetical protein
MGCAASTPDARVGPESQPAPATPAVVGVLDASDTTPRAASGDATPTVLKPTTASVDRIPDAEPPKPPLPFTEAGRAPHSAREAAENRHVGEGPPTTSAAAPTSSAGPVWQAQLQEEADAGAAAVMVSIDWDLAAAGAPCSVRVLPV